MISLKKLLMSAVITLLAALPLSVSAATVADWQFNEESVVSGSIASGSMIIKDFTGNGNDLTMRTYGWAYKNTASFTDESIDGKSGSIFLNGNLLLGGIDFVTVDTAPINKNNFASGYTIEILYKMPSDWTAADRWQSLIARLAPSANAPSVEDEKVSSTINISNCKEIQFSPRDKDGDSVNDVWSIAMDKAENWYHIVIMGDNNGIRTFVNGCESFRDADVNTMQGLYTDSADGRFRIASKTNSSGSISKYTRGYIQQIRISDTALSRENWLVPNPEKFMGEYGDNSPFEETEADRYNMVFVPDTQNTTKFKGNVLDKAVDWLIENKDYANIEAIVSLGDNVEDFWETPQWQQITKTYSSLAQNGIRTIVPTGNHDSGDGQNFWYHNTYFGPGSDFAKLAEPYMLEYSPSGTGGIADISAGSFPYKLIYVDMYKINDIVEMAWFNSALLKYSDCPVIVTMHDIQNCSDTKPNETMLSENGSVLWQTVKQYDNVFMMVGGHSHGYGVLELTNAYGNKVYSILADYQFAYNGGNALCKFAEFDEKEGKIRISTFSPYVATLSEDEKSFFDVNFMTGKGNYDEIDINFKERFSNFDASYRAIGENIMANPSFEDANGNFSLDGWLSAQTNAAFGSPYSTNHCYAVNNSAAISNNVSTDITSTIPDGSWAFGSRWNDGKDGLCSLKRYVPVERGKTYIVSYKVKHKTGADGAYLITSLVANDGAEENITTATSAGYIGTEWTTVERAFTATNNTDYVLFWFRWLGGDNNGGLGPYWYFDDFSIREAEAEHAAFTMNLDAVKNGETVSVTFDYTENTAASHFIVAGFDKDGKLISLASTQTGKADLTGSSIETVKVFCWSDITSITPLATAKEVTVE